MHCFCDCGKFLVCLLIFIPAFFRVHNEDIVNASIRLSVRPSRYRLLHHWEEFTQTCYMISPHGKSVQEQQCFPSAQANRKGVVKICFPYIYVIYSHITPISSDVFRQSGYYMTQFSCYVTSHINKSHLTISCAHKMSHNTHFVRTTLFIHLFVTIFPPKPLSRIKPNLLNRSW